MSERPDEQMIKGHLIQTQEAEMKRIAFELHESIGQTLASLYSGMQIVEKKVDEPMMKEYIGVMVDQLEQIVQEVRSLSVELHPPSLTNFGLVAALKNYLQLYTSTYGIEVDFESSGSEVALCERKRVALFRVCQKAFTNIAKYADTSRASIRLHWGEAVLSVTIQDRGRGFHVKETVKHSAGLASMKERIHLVGGEWEITSTIGEGTFIKMSLPL
ncbi:sensor histidine kinase [Bacillus sp. FJAT-50079]|uniref:sensor histidine kinase n=1 Tax=Bacillus sp. FJAT-50079 TaxID=2833577 RepID=UPI001BCA005D|nr:sensor histidine kinase [Bacillus sp. FJAT-50079]MBS4209219.1 sensor histidine kinase [Bacillus sp. FJAT-50079]